MKNIAIIFLYAVVAIIIVYLIFADFKSNAPVEKKETVFSYGVPDLTLPETIFFAGERVPLEIPDVRERLDRELHVNTFWHSNTIFLLKRGNRWLPSIREILAEYDVPSDLMYLAVIESDLLNKVSPSNAVGFWQLLKGTAQDFKLEVNNEVDERYHPIKSTHAAANYLKKAHEKFGTWANAAASYNIGRRGLGNALDKQDVVSYYDLLVVEETSRYLFRAIAIKMIFENPSHFGFNISEENLYHKEDLEDIEITNSIRNLRDWAFEHDINYKILKRYNPWLRTNSLTVRKGKTYIFQIPKKYSSAEIVRDSTTFHMEVDSTETPDVRELPTRTGDEM